MSEGTRVLVVDDDAEMRVALELTLKKAKYSCVLARDGQEALDRLRRETFDLVITDLRMPRVDGLELLERMSAAAPRTPALVITAHGSIDTAVESMKRGAVDFLQKPFGVDVLLAKTAAVLARASSETALSTDGARRALIAEDPAMDGVLRMVEAAAATRATVLITGESGTGKEVVARRIHELSGWAAGKPFVAVNCAAIPANLMESELFGHEKGAFTGATETRVGKFEQAQGGTILLDEVSEMDPALQAKLLRVLQEREVERVGGRRPLALDVRVIATTNRDLPEEVRKGGFREDLYYRLQVIPVRLPPLRERPADILPLARHFLSVARQSHGRAPSGFAPNVEKAIVSYSWPGNVRELQNAVERAAILCSGELVELPQLILEGVLGKRGAEGPALTGTLEEMEQQLILAAFEKQGRNKKATARALGINIKTLRARLRGYGVEAAGDDEGEEEEP